MVKRYPAIALLIIVLAGAAMATGGSIIRSFESPCNDQTDGIDYRGGYLYHANFNGPCEVLKTKTNGALVASLKEPPNAIGVDFTGFVYWVYTYWPSVPRDRICRVNQAGSVAASFAAPSYGYGVTYDGERLWYSTAGNHNWNYVYALTTTGSVISSFQAPHGRSYLNKDIDWGGGYLWLAQSGSIDGVIYQMTTAGSVVYSLLTVEHQPTGVAWDGKNVWFADGRTDWVYLMKWSGIGVEPASIGKVKALFR
jgi:DNA-binding beta-propeller fold protein YncE